MKLQSEQAVAVAARCSVLQLRVVPMSDISREKFVLHGLFHGLWSLMAWCGSGLGPISTAGEVQLDYFHNSQMGTGSLRLMSFSFATTTTTNPTITAVYNGSISMNCCVNLRVPWSHASTVLFSVVWPSAYFAHILHSVVHGAFFLCCGCSKS